MLLTGKSRQIIKSAGLVNALLFVLCVVLILSLGLDRSLNDLSLRKVVAFFIANIACWLVNLTNYISLWPLLSKKGLTGKALYYLVGYTVAVFFIVSLANPVFHMVGLSKVREPNEIYIYGFGFNSIALLSLELIISRQERVSMRLENADLRMMSLQAQHEKLKNQLHPHFLFNSLNAAKALIRKNPVLAESYIIKLSDFLRFSISHNEHNLVTLKEEMKFSLYYLEMQKIRFKDSLLYEIDDQLHGRDDLLLPVFSLQLLVENAIKHNGLTSESPLVIRIFHAGPNWLVVENNLSRRLTMEEGNGTGLKNLGDRYKLLSGEDIIVKSDTGTFQVYIKLLSK